MPLVPTARPDVAEIYRLIEARGYTVTEFGRKIHRHPGSIWNLNQGVNVSKNFIRQMATALGVRPSQISDMPAEDDDVPEALASLTRKIAARRVNDGTAMTAPAHSVTGEVKK